MRPPSTLYMLVSALGLILSQPALATSPDPHTIVITHGFTPGLDHDVGGSTLNCNSNIPKPTGCPEVTATTCGVKPNPGASRWIYTMAEAMAAEIGTGTCTERSETRWSV